MSAPISHAQPRGAPRIPPAEIDGHIRLAFILGHPVGHSHSPAMHRAAFAAMGLSVA